MNQLWLRFQSQPTMMSSTRTMRRLLPIIWKKLKAMDSAVSVLPEPILEFRHHQGLVDPHDGLAMFGPYDGDLPSEPGSISYGVIGTPAGIAAFGAWSQLMKKATPPECG